MTLNEINIRIDRVEKLKFIAMRYSNIIHLNGNQAAYDNFSRKYAMLSVYLNKLWGEQLSLVRVNEIEHRKTVVGQFLKNSSGMNGRDILIKTIVEL